MLLQKKLLDNIEPPPPHLKQTFKNLQDWLIDICGSEKPQKTVSFYTMGFFESREGRVMFLVGMSKSDNKEKMVFQPRNTYFLLPPAEYKDVSQEQLDDKLINQIRDFTKTKDFSDSYLAQSDSILFRGKTVIWSKPR